MPAFWDKIRKLFFKNKSVSNKYKPDAVKTSFSKIRSENDYRDNKINKILNRLNYHSLSIKSHEKLLSYIEKRLQQLETGVGKPSATYMEALPTLSPTSPTVITASATVENMQNGMYADIDTLTRLQQETFYTLANLIYKTNAKWVSIKSLVSELYPGRPYNTVRTTIFEYIKTLEEIGLVDRQKRGILTYLAITEKGTGIIKDKESHIKKKIVKIAQTKA